MHGENGKGVAGQEEAKNDRRRRKEDQGIFHLGQLGADVLRQQVVQGHGNKEEEAQDHAH